MNTDEVPPSGDAGFAKPTVASRFAVLSFASGLVFCCPGTSLLAILAGVSALLLGMRERGASWRKYAVGGVLLGLGSVTALLILYTVAHGRWEREWRVLYTGPNNALYLLETGSPASFRAEFTGGAADGSDADVEAFRIQLEKDLGQFLRAHSIRQSPPDLDGTGPWELGEFEAFFSKAGADPPWEGAVAAKIGINRLPSGTLRLTWVLLEGKGPQGEDVRIRYPALGTAEVPDD